MNTSPESSQEQHADLGDSYRRLWLIQFAFEALKRKCDFNLAYKVKECGKFNDIYFEFSPVGNKEVQVMKVRYFVDKSKYSAKDQFHEVFNDCLLDDYFSSYLKMKKSSFFSNKNIINLILCSNSEFIPNNNFEAVNYSVFLNAPGCVYKMRENSNLFGKFLDTLSNQSLSKLALELTTCILNGTHVRDDEDSIFEEYSHRLLQYVIDKQINKIKKDFLLNDSSALPDDIREFRNVFSGIFSKELQKSPNKSVRKKQKTTRHMFNFQGDVLQEISSKDITLTLRKNFGVDPSKKKLLNKGKNDSSVKHFLNLILFVLNQPDEIEFEKNLFQKIEKEYSFMQIKGARERLLIKMDEWMKNKKGYFLSEAKAKDMFNFPMNPIRFGVLDPMSLFTGRTDEVRYIHTCKDEVLVIVGLGGIGKSEIVRKYIKEYYSNDMEFNILWVDFRNEGTFKECMIRLAKDSLHIATEDMNRNERDFKEEILNDIYDYFENKNVLLILDNADNEDMQSNIINFLSKCTTSGKNRVIITSQIQAWNENFRYLNIEPLPEKDAVEFMHKATKLQSEKTLSLVRKLSCIPLALNSASAYISEESKIRNFNIDSYLELYEKSSSCLFKYKFNDDNNYDKTVNRALALTFKKVEELEKLSYELLKNISMYASDHIRIAYLMPLQDFLGDINKILLLLEKYSLIKIHTNYIEIHGFLQNVIRASLTYAEKYEVLSRSFSYWIHNSDQLHPDDVRHVTRGIVLVDKELKSFKSDNKFFFMLRVACYPIYRNPEAYEINTNNDQSHVCKLLAQIKQCICRIFSIPHPYEWMEFVPVLEKAIDLNFVHKYVLELSLTSSVNSSSSLNEKKERFENEITFCKSAIETNLMPLIETRLINDLNFFRKAQLQSVLGMLCMCLNQFDEAEKLLKQCLKTYKAKELSDKVRKIEKALGFMYSQQNRCNDALTYLEKLKEQPRPEDIDEIFSMLTKIYRKLGKLEEMDSFASKFSKMQLRKQRETSCLIL